MGWPATTIAMAMGVVIVIAGSELLLDGVLGLSRRIGVSAFAVVVVVSGIELENLAAGVAANLGGFPGAALGTSLGGATFLALAVAGLSGVIVPTRIALPLPVYGWTALSPLPLIALAADGVLSRIDGVVLLAWFGVCTVGLARAGSRFVVDDDDETGGWFDRIVGGFHPVVPAVVGLVLLGVGGNLLSDGLRPIVAGFPYAPTLLGNTVLAAAVEGEEVARVVAPARRGRGDLALGNVLGTVVHFLTLNAGVMALARPLPIDRATATIHLPASVLAVAACLILTRLRTGLDRAGGALLLALYATYIAAALRWPEGW